MHVFRSTFSIRSLAIIKNDEDDCHSIFLIILELKQIKILIMV